MPQLLAGRTLEVSAGVVCQDVRDSLGVVACVVPFNFPAMVPLWTAPIALGAGNCVILKPSEKVPMTMHRIIKLWERAGGPPGVFQMVNGAVPVVEALCDHPDVSAVTFVGSSRVAELVAQRCRAINKRVLALGGAKNHLVALPDCDQDMVVNDILTSAFGSAGQRCMAASALVLVGDTGPLLESICTAAAALQPGSGVGEIGPIIDGAGGERIMRYIAEAEAAGTQVLLDGRGWLTDGAGDGGCFIGPTILLHASAEDAAMQDEIFGPVLSVIKVTTADGALAVERANPHGNAACVYTQSGASGEYFASRFNSAMIGVNIGIPVPREPFSFGGLYGTKSKYGDMDITADGAMEFFTSRRKITTKWSSVRTQSPRQLDFQGWF